MIIQFEKKKKLTQMGKPINARNWINRYKGINPELFLEWIETIESFGFEESKCLPAFASRNGDLIMINYETKESITIECGLISLYKKPFSIRYNIDNDPRTDWYGKPYSKDFKRFRSIKAFKKFLIKTTGV